MRVTFFHLHTRGHRQGITGYMRKLQVNSGRELGSGKPHSFSTVLACMCVMDFVMSCPVINIMFYVACILTSSSYICNASSSL